MISSASGALPLSSSEDFLMQKCDVGDVLVSFAAAAMALAFQRCNSATCQTRMKLLATYTNMMYGN